MQDTEHTEITSNPEDDQQKKDQETQDNNQTSKMPYQVDYCPRNSSKFC